MGNLDLSPHSLARSPRKAETWMSYVNDRFVWRRMPGFAIWKYSSKQHGHSRCLYSILWPILYSSTLFPALLQVCHVLLSKSFNLSESLFPFLPFCFSSLVFQHRNCPLCVCMQGAPVYSWASRYTRTTDKTWLKMSKCLGKTNLRLIFSHQQPFIEENSTQNFRKAPTQMHKHLSHL